MLYNSAGVIPKDVNIDDFCRYVFSYKKLDIVKHPNLPKCGANDKTYKRKANFKKKGRSTEPAV